VHALLGDGSGMATLAAQLRHVYALCVLHAGIGWDTSQSLMIRWQTLHTASGTTPGAMSPVQVSSWLQRSTGLGVIHQQQHADMHMYLWMHFMQYALSASWLGSPRNAMTQVECHLPCCVKVLMDTNVLQLDPRHSK